jgi:hypothetical protein
MNIPNNTISGYDWFIGKRKLIWKVSQINFGFSLIFLMEGYSRIKLL